MKKLLLILASLTVASLASAQLQLNGAGATFPYVLYSKWFDVVKNNTGIQFNYQSIGSGGGIKQMIEGTVDFGATDGPMKDEQLAEAKAKQGSDILHFPTVLGAVVVTYNVKEIGADLALSPEVLADIFLGKIKIWNDPAIAALNKGRQFPAKSIIVVHRSDGSGTTFIFVDYLSKVSDQWKSKVGVGTAVNWPTGLGGKGNEGVSGQVKQMDGSIGYVELAYAVKNSLPYVTIRNKSGKFIKPSIESVTAAALGESKKMPEDFRISITNADGKDSYPISGYTWLLIRKEQKDVNKAKAIVQFLRWAYTDGEKLAAPLLYAPLPDAVVKRCLKAVLTITSNGKPLP
jgi:phosphate transport system substrate-binding protein